MNIIGRSREKSILNRLFESKEAEFLALYGRRRVGKTHLIRMHYQSRLCFELTGSKNIPLKEQLNNFHYALAKVCKKKYDIPSSWQEAFRQLADYLKNRRSKKKYVLFLDEVPWLAGPRSKFLEALDYFWNTEASKDPRCVLVICGSAASWMIAKVIHNKGGLHNRVTQTIRLEPFQLAESSQYLKSRGVKLTEYDQLTLHMATGGVPHYLKFVEKGWSAAQAIDNLCFTKDGLLRNEFEQLYSSLFDKPHRHLDIVRQLANKPQGLLRKALTCSHSTGGRLTDVLKELEEAGFIRKTSPYGKKTKDSIYRLVDEYSLFYLKWIENSKLSRATQQCHFLKLYGTPSWRAWSGYALEAIAEKHLPQIHHALGISQLATECCSWVHKPDATYPDGTQIDLLIDRADNTVNLIEIKFSNGRFTINKNYASQLRQKRQVFSDVTKTSKNVFITFLTTYGVTDNPYAKELVQNEITTSVLFLEVL
jgi:hypothetical protein